jgi:hypothetical protein
MKNCANCGDRCKGFYTDPIDGFGYFSRTDRCKDCDKKLERGGEWYSKWYPVNTVPSEESERLS